MLALVNNVPKVLNLKEIIKNYIDHRKDIVRKRTLFDLHKAEQRAHILEGLLIALNNIDQTIKIVKQSKAVEDAKQSLISSFSLSEQQSIAILEMRLQRLTSLEQDKIKQEHSELKKFIIGLKSILENPQKIRDIIKNELSESKTLRPIHVNEIVDKAVEDGRLYLFIVAVGFKTEGRKLFIDKRAN